MYFLPKQEAWATLLGFDSGEHQISICVETWSEHLETF